MPGGQYRKVSEIRFGYVKRWVAKLSTVITNEDAAVGTLIDIAAMAPAHHSAWSPVSAIDTYVNKIVRNAAPAASISP